MCKNRIYRFDGDGILWVYSVVKEQRRFDPSLVPTEKPESYTHFEKIILRKRKSPIRNWSERAVSVCINTLFPRGNFYLLEDGNITCRPCAQFGHMELLAHSLMIYYFQRENFTLWEAMPSSSKASIWGLGRLQVRGKIHPVPKSQLSSKISNW